jgi:hypothetical protein
MPIAKAMRHNRYNSGYVFSLGLSIAITGQRPEANTDKPEVGR